MIADRTSASNDLSEILKSLNGADAPRYCTVNTGMSPAYQWPNNVIVPTVSTSSLTISRGTASVTEGRVESDLRPVVEIISDSQKLFHFVEKAKASGEITPETGEAAWKTWTLIWKTMSKCFTVPDASYGPNGQFLFFWDKGEHHLEIELDPSEGGYFFYRNRVSGTSWSSDYRVGDQLSVGIIEKLEKFA